MKSSILSLMRVLDRIVLSLLNASLRGSLVVRKIIKESYIGI